MTACPLVYGNVKIYRLQTEIAFLHNLQNRISGSIVRRIHQVHDNRKAIGKAT